MEGRQVQELVSRDANALLDGIPLGAGYRALAGRLRGWRSIHCAETGRMLTLSGAGGRSTELLFKGNRFAAVNVGLSGAGGCPPWPPSLLAAPVGQL